LAIRASRVSNAKRFNYQASNCGIVLLAALRFLCAKPWRWRITNATWKPGNNQSKKGPAVWQFRWSEKDLHGSRVQRKRVLGTVERYPSEAAARSAVAVLLAEINADKVRMGSRSITVAQLCDHFEQRELAKDNTWRSYSTKKDLPCVHEPLGSSSMVAIRAC